MPWRPRYGEADARAAIARATSWREATDALGLRYHGKTVATLRRWSDRWGIDCSHLQTRAPTRQRYTEAEARAAIAASRSWSESLRKLGYCHTGANPKTLKKRAREWGISTDHFDPRAALREAQRRKSLSLDEILVERSSFTRHALKKRLYEEGLKKRECEECGQGELWRGRRIGLILDHINGVRDDNRLENLRILCPNCAAALDTHCGRKNRLPREPRECLHCGASFVPRDPRQRYCSRACGSRWERKPGQTRAAARKVKERPPYERLRREVERLGYSAVGRKYGVSDNAVRKWLRAYARERAVAAGEDPGSVAIPRRTWPNRRELREAA